MSRIKQLFLLVLVILFISSNLLACVKGDALTTFKEQYDLGVRYLSEGKHEEAILVFNALIEINPNSVDIYLGLADAYIGIGDYTAAITALELGLENIGEDKIIEMRLNEIHSMEDEISVDNNSSSDLSYMLYSEGDLAGYIRSEIIDKLAYSALSTAKIIKVQDKFYSNIVLPELPKGYKWDVTTSITEDTILYGTEINGYSNFLEAGENTCPIDVVQPVDSDQEGDIMISLSIYVVNLDHINTDDRMGGFRGDYVYSVVYKYRDGSKINFSGEDGLFKQFYFSPNEQYDYNETIEFDASYIWKDVLEYFDSNYGQ